MNKASERQRRYDKGHTVGFYVKLNLETDKDIIEKLKAVENRQGYLKNLIREDMARSQAE